MLKEIFVDGYKSIDQESVELKPFTLFSGINSAGKSSMIQAINYVLDLQSKQSDLQDDRGDAEIGRFVDVRNNIKGNREIVFKMQEEDLSGEKYDLEVIFSGSETSNVTKLTAPVIERYKKYVNEFKKIYLSVERIGVQNTYELNVHNPLAMGNRGKYAFSYLAYFGQEALK